MRKIILLLCLVPACLPTKREIVTCTGDEVCKAISSRLVCTKGFCTCANGDVTLGCDQEVDGSSIIPRSDARGDLPVDPAMTPDVPPPIDNVDVIPPAPGVDAPVDLPPPDTYEPDGAGTCAVSGDCKDPRAFCVDGMCVGCSDGDGGISAAMCAAPTPYCHSSGKCVGCLDYNQCASGSTPICAKDACAPCTADPQQCRQKKPALPACRADGQCVECTTDNTTACPITAKLCDANNKCVQCLTSADCSGNTPICGGDNKCKACANDTACEGLNVAGRAACDKKTGACVLCTEDNATHCPTNAPACDGKTNACVLCTSLSYAKCSGLTPLCGNDNKCRGCVGHADCGTLGDALRGACNNGACVQCTATDKLNCPASTPACDTNTNTCVMCVSSVADCMGTTPICGANHTCKVCAGDTDCESLSDPLRVACNGGTGACVECTNTNNSKCSGTTTPLCKLASNKCVRCLENADCPAGGSTPICAKTTDNSCRGCSGASECSGFAGKACASTGACVQCTAADHSACTGTTPICQATAGGAASQYTCRACANDSECTSGPNVCLPDGHCATDAEAVFVGTFGGATCNESNAGTSQGAPVCSLQTGIGVAVFNSRPVVVVRGVLTVLSSATITTSALTIVGKSGAKTTAPSPNADAITISSGNIYLRNLTIQGQASPTGIGKGIYAGTGSALHMDTCSVIGNPGGGILLDGAAFDIKNTKVTGNGPGQTGGGTFWGGVRVDALPGTGTTSLALMTISNNNPIGLSCVGGIQGTGVLASGNTSGQISNSCNVTACTPASYSCGAPP